jgi:hypothetical protein
VVLEVGFRVVWVVREVGRDRQPCGPHHQQPAASAQALQSVICVCECGVCVRVCVCVRACVCVDDKVNLIESSNSLVTVGDQLRDLLDVGR